jgi:hypothetical protein
LACRCLSRTAGLICASCTVSEGKVCTLHPPRPRNVQVGQTKLAQKWMFAATSRPPCQRSMSTRVSISCGQKYRSHTACGLAVGIPNKQSRKLYSISGSRIR